MQKSHRRQWKFIRFIARVEPLHNIVSEMNSYRKFVLRVDWGGVLFWGVGWKKDPIFIGLVREFLSWQEIWQKYLIAVLKSRPKLYLVLGLVSSLCQHIMRFLWFIPFLLELDERMCFSLGFLVIITWLMGLCCFV